MSSAVALFRHRRINYISGCQYVYGLLETNLSLYLNLCPAMFSFVFLILSLKFHMILLKFLEQCCNELDENRRNKRASNWFNKEQATRGEGNLLKFVAIEIA